MAGQFKAPMYSVFAIREIVFNQNKRDTLKLSRHCKVPTIHRKLAKKVDPAYYEETSTVQCMYSPRQSSVCDNISYCTAGLFFSVTERRPVDLMNKYSKTL